MPGSRPMAPRLIAATLLTSVACLAASLPREIGRVLDSSAVSRSAFWGIQIVELGTGRTVYELNADRLFVPASNTKLFSSALALRRLGAGHRFVTRVLAASEPDADGRIHGDLTLVGGGDANLSGRALPYRVGADPGNALSALEALADQVKARGVRRIEGDIAGDDSWFVWQPYVEGWAVDDPLYEYGAPVSALAVNDNAFALRVRPGARVGDPGVLALDPAVEYYAIDNRVRTAGLGAERKIRVERNATREQLRVWGTIPLRDRGETILLGVADPALYAATAFRQVLEQRGIAVSGGQSARHLFANEVADLTRGPAARPPAGVELARRVSAPLLESLQVIDKVSQNLHAEMTLRAVGRERRGIGSQEAGLKELETFLYEVGIGPESYNLVDASGLARLNLVSPNATVRLLRHMYSAPEREGWLSLLPVGGEDGTLSDRFGEPAAAGRILAKTGTLSHVSALSGYARRADGAWLAFSILVNNYNGRAADIRGVLDRICTLMIE